MVIHGLTKDDAIQIAYTIDRHDQPTTSARWRRVIAGELRRRFDIDRNTARTIRKTCVQHGLYVSPGRKYRPLPK